MHYSLSLITKEKPDAEYVNYALSIYGPENLVTVEYYDKEEMLELIERECPDINMEDISSDDTLYENTVRELFDFPYETDEDPGIDTDGNVYIKEPEDMRFDWYTIGSDRWPTILIKKDGERVHSCRIEELDLETMDRLSMQEDNEPFMTHAIYDTDNTGIWSESDDIYLFDTYESIFRKIIENPEYKDYYITIIDCHI